jgi:hypothetical protein
VPKLETALTFDQATAPAVLKGYRGEVVVRVSDNLITLKFPTMHHAASWANMAGLEAQTWPSGPVQSFKDWVRVDVMSPEV